MMYAKNLRSINIQLLFSPYEVTAVLNNRQYRYKHFHIPGNYAVRQRLSRKLNCVYCRERSQ